MGFFWFIYLSFFFFSPFSHCVFRVWNFCALVVLEWAFCYHRGTSVTGNKLQILFQLSTENWSSCDCFSANAPKKIKDSSMFREKLNKVSSSPPIQKWAAVPKLKTCLQRVKKKYMVGISCFHPFIFFSYHASFAFLSTLKKSIHEGYVKEDTRTTGFFFRWKIRATISPVS